MSTYFDYDGDGGNMEDLPEDYFEDDNDDSMNDNSGNRPPNNFRNARYDRAFGDYRGGYGMGGGYGPPPGFSPGPPMMWGRGFGPQGPPMRRNHMDERVIRFLTRCGMPKEYMKNLPRDLLYLMEPEYCGLCAVSLESFSSSRLHYISKNHLKNQKKWLNQNSEGMFLQNREVPLRSRDLYCELCDVQITSKAHAQTHYAGKPHRSIVEGRKNPRNPVLLQMGMERRVEQLIRREKKYLKPIEETPEGQEEPPKPIQPDLYCDICKTSVTCSEQMTMHLNGKRHLAKEKQHILKMMKGQANENETDPDGNADGNADGNIDVKVGDAQAGAMGGSGDHQQDNAGEDFGWGQGEEKWEDTTNN